MTQRKFHLFIFSIPISFTIIHQEENKRISISDQERKPISWQKTKKNKDWLYSLLENSTTSNLLLITSTKLCFVLVHQTFIHESFVHHSCCSWIMLSMFVSARLIPCTVCVQFLCYIRVHRNLVFFYWGLFLWCLHVLGVFYWGGNTTF